MTRSAAVTTTRAGRCRMSVETARIIPADGSPGRVDMSVGDRLRQRAAMSGERERAELAAFEALLSKCIADALVAEVWKEAEAQGVDVVTWLTRDKSTDE